jgi:hypothetical protein
VAPALNPLERALQRIVSELSSVGRSVALVGGLAVSARAEPRTTRDVDLAVSVAGDEDAEQLVFHLQNRGYVVRMLLEREESGRIATIRLTRDTERAIYVDLLFASSGIETEIVNDAEPTEIVEGISVPVATRAHLIALKVLARDDRNRPRIGTTFELSCSMPPAKKYTGHGRRSSSSSSAATIVGVHSAPTWIERSSIPRHTSVLVRSSRLARIDLEPQPRCSRQ